eukprot:1399028-Amphidinium_carterae.1
MFFGSITVSKRYFWELFSFTDYRHRRSGAPSSVQHGNGNCHYRKRFMGAIFSPVSVTVTEKQLQELNG